MRIGPISITATLLLATGCGSTGLAPVGNSLQPAPDFSLATLKNQKIGLVDLKGKVVVLDFWATWCPPCAQALPHLQATATDTNLAQRGLVVLAVDEGEKPETIRSFNDDRHFTFTVVQDADGSVARDYSVLSLPMTFVIGRDGLVRAVISGWDQNTAQQIDAAIAQALDSPVR